VQDLTARETACCSFFTFTITPQTPADGEAMVLDVEVPPSYADVLDSLAERASTISAASAVGSGGLLDLDELAARAGVPAQRLREYAEAGLLSPDHRDGNRDGYPPADAPRQSVPAAGAVARDAADRRVARHWRGGVP